MSRYAIAYVGPWLMMSFAKVRETPYLTSSQVTSLPSCQVSPSFRVKLHWVASALAVPVSVAMSATTDVPLTGSGSYL